MKRRGFLEVLLSATTSPAIVKASSLMPISAASQNSTRIIVSENKIIDVSRILYGDGIHYDVAALSAYFVGEEVYKYNEFGFLVPVTSLIGTCYWFMNGGDWFIDNDRFIDTSNPV